jgi:hypothetical protein
MPSDARLSASSPSEGYRDGHPAHESHLITLDDRQWLRGGGGSSPASDTNSTSFSMRSLTGFSERTISRTRSTIRLSQRPDYQSCGTRPTESLTNSCKFLDRYQGSRSNGTGCDHWPEPRYTSTIPSITFHGLRRTYASLRCACGDDMRYVSAQIGPRGPALHVEGLRDPRGRDDGERPRHVRPARAQIDRAANEHTRNRASERLQVRLADR